MKIGLNQLAYDRPSGPVPAKLADISPEFVSAKFGQHQFIMTWILANTYEDKDKKTQHMMHSEYISASIHKKSKLRGIIIDGLLGKATTDEWFQKNFPDGYDPSRLIGKGMVLVLKNDEDGYSHLQAVMKATPECNAIDISGYKRPQWIEDTVKDSAGTKPGTVDAAANVNLADVMATDVNAI